MPLPFVARAALLALLAAPAVAQAPDTLRLDVVLGAVSDANPTLAAARLDADALAQRGDQVGARPDPTASVMLAPFPVLTARGAQRSQWRVEQALPWPGALGLRRRSADLAAAVSGAEADALSLDLAFEARRAFYDLVHAHHVEAVLVAYQARLGAFAEAAAVRYEVGRGPQAAILQVQLERERIAQRLFMLEAHRVEALQTLARLADRPDLVGTPVAVEPPALPDDLDALVALAFEARPERRALALARQRAAAEVALAQKAVYPELAVGVVYTDIADRDVPMTADGRDAIGVMVSGRIPLDRGRLRAREAEARVRVAETAARAAALDTSLRTQVAALAERVRQTRRAHALYQERLLPLAATTVESTLAAYTTGEADYLSFLGAERTRFEVALAAADAHHHVLVAVAALQRALGTDAIDAPAPAPGHAAPHHR
ncbi:TolC family protein [Rubrivirga sp. IMCC45206]|uniref:TolC family protein n=1 Tax=Rubrivirga sp. IMCC45206 TaxID=3391614 RepID=UPI00398FE664